MRAADHPQGFAALNPSYASDAAACWRRALAPYLRPAVASVGERGTLAQHRDGSNS